MKYGASTHLPPHMPEEAKGRVKHHTLVRALMEFAQHVEMGRSHTLTITDETVPIYTGYGEEYRVNIDARIK